MKSRFGKWNRRLRRRRHIRRRVRGTPERPRLTVFRSNKNIYAQIIDDVRGVTLVASSSRGRDLQEELQKIERGKTEVARVVGLDLARRAKEKGIEKVAFDRGFYRYHGRVKALADGARAGGLAF